MLGVLARPADPPTPGPLQIGGVAVDRVLSQGAQIASLLPGGRGSGRGLSLSGGLQALSNISQGGQQNGWGYDS